MWPHTESCGYSESVLMNNFTIKGIYMRFRSRVMYGVLHGWPVPGASAIPVPSELTIYHSKVEEFAVEDE